MVKLPPEELVSDSDHSSISDGEQLPIEALQHDAPFSKSPHASPKTAEASSSANMGDSPGVANVEVADDQTTTTPVKSPPLSLAILANYTDADQKQMLGERMFPLIKKYFPSCPGKLTGMLLDFDSETLLNFISCPYLLRAKALEAYEVYNDYLEKLKREEEEKKHESDDGLEEKLTSDEGLEEKLTSDEDPEEKLTSDEDPEEKLTSDEDPEEKLTSDEDPEEKLTSDEDPEEKLTSDEDPEEKLTSDEDPEEKLTSDEDTEAKLASAKGNEAKLESVKENEVKLANVEENEAKLANIEENEAKLKICKGMKLN